MKEDQEPGTGELLWIWLKSTWKAFAAWLKPNPGDAWYMHLLKGIGKFVVVLLTILLSPIILLVLIIAFFVAF